MNYILLLLLNFKGKKGDRKGVDFFPVLVISLDLWMAHTIHLRHRNGKNLCGSFFFPPRSLNWLHWTNETARRRRGVAREAHILLIAYQCCIALSTIVMHTLDRCTRCPRIKFTTFSTTLTRYLCKVLIFG